MESVILKFLLENQGAVDTDFLTCNLGSGDVIDDVIRNRERFALCEPFGQSKVVARTRMKLCRVLECPGSCDMLHLCRQFLFTGNCPFNQRRGGCKHSHELGSGHNAALLSVHGLESLSRTELRTLLMQSDTWNQLIPEICHNYNNGGGGLCADGDDCKRLHVCERYMNRDCRRDCPKAHDFTAPQPYACLQKRSVPDDLLPALRAAYANKLALKYHDRKSSGGGAAANNNHDASGDGGQNPGARQWVSGRGGNRGHRGNRGNRAAGIVPAAPPTPPTPPPKKNGSCVVS